MIAPMSSTIASVSRKSFRPDGQEQHDAAGGLERHEVAADRRCRLSEDPDADVPAWSQCYDPAGVGNTRGASIANSGHRLRDFAESLCISAMAPGSSSPGRV